MADPPVTKRRKYKGEELAIADLADKNMPVIQFPEPIGGVPTFGVVEDVQQSWEYNKLRVTLLNPLKDFQRVYKDVPKDTRVIMLTGRQGDKFAKAHHAHMLTEGFTSLRHFTSFMGADPEVFVEDKDGNIIPSWLFLGSKAEPTRPEEGSYYGSNNCYWDGFQAEFDVNPGACLAYVVDSVRAGLKGTLAAARKEFPDSKLSIRSVVPVDPETLATGKEEHVQFGCMPSYNVYGLKGNDRHGRDVAIRFAGGHIHFGRPITKAKAPAIVKALDAILGVTATSLFGAFDNPVRRQYYGLPGEYRLPPHGLEYRTLSNAWLMHPVTYHIVFEIARRAWVLGEQGMLPVWGVPEEQTRDILLKTDVMAARKLLIEKQDIWTKLMTFGPFYGYQDRLYQMVMEGAESFIANPADIEGNWNLNGEWIPHGESYGKNFKKAMAVILKGGKL